MSAPLIALRGVSFGYPGRPQVLETLDCSLQRGERVALLGANGAGKSTLLQLLVGLRRPRAGRVEAFGRHCRSERDFRAVRRRVGLLFQDPDDQLFCPTVLEDVAFGPLNLGKPVGEARRIAADTLTALGLAELAERITHKLSGGEKRLVSLATVLAMQPDVLLLDEPTNGLDPDTAGRLTAHLQGLPLTLLFVSHDPRFVEALATRALLLREGRLSAAVLHRHPHSHSHEHLHVHAAGEPALHEHQDLLDGHRHGG